MTPQWLSSLMGGGSGSGFPLGSYGSEASGKATVTTPVSFGSPNLDFSKGKQEISWLPVAVIAGLFLVGILALSKRGK